MNNLYDCISKQIKFNQNKNLFFGEPHHILSFAQETIETLKTKRTYSSYEKSALASYATEMAIKEFCLVNQFYTFNAQSRDKLKCIYNSLFSTIEENDMDVGKLAHHHYTNLKNWLSESNPFAENIYVHHNIELKPVVSAEYSADLQCEIFHLKTDEILQPVLDIGCGTKHNFVSYLNNIGLKSYGIDRFTVNTEITEKADWLEYNYGVEKWGTIISNLGFSNHFVHNHIREDGNFIQYAGKYMEILHALKPGGCFYYAPDLPFIETYLDKNKFKTTHYPINDLPFKATKVTRIK